MSIARLARIARQRLRSLVRKRALDRDLDRELAFHLDALTGEYIADGVPPEEARRRARQAFGNAPLLADLARDERRVNWFHDARQDAVHAWRGLRRQPTFAIVAMLSLALGIGANAAVLTVLGSIRVAALPFPHPDELAFVRTTTSDAARPAGVRLTEFLDWRARNDVFDVMGAGLNYQLDFNADDNGAPPERIIGQTVTADLFTTLNVAPLRGRWFTEAESQLEQPVPVVVLSYRLWQRRYAGDPDILAKRVRVAGVSTTIVGVMPATFRFLDRRAEFWVPLRINRQRPDPTIGFFVAGRLSHGVTKEQAQAALTTLGLQPGPRQGPGRPERTGVRVDSIRDVMYDWATAPLLTLQVSVCFVLLIACANVASLLLARGSARQQEFALRAALGAGRGRLIRQLLMESAVLAGLGGLAGLLVAWIGVRALLASMSAPVGSPRLPLVTPDAGTIAIAGVMTIVALACVGLAPALSSSRARLSPGEKHRPSGGHATAATRSRGVLIGVQTAWALMLLVAAGLLLNSFVRQLARDMHFEERGLLTFDYRVSDAYTRPIGTIRGATYFELTASPADRLTAVYDRLARAPGVKSVAGISNPLETSLIVPTAGVFADGRTPPETDPDPAPPSMMFFLVTPNFFTTLRATLVSGRDFDASDSAASPWVAVVNETAAHRLWPGEDALGRQLTLDTVPDDRARQVVGVVRDMPIRRKQTDAQAVVYVSYLQQPSRSRSPLSYVFGQMSFVVRAADGDAERLMPVVRQAVAEFDPDRPLSNLSVLTDLGVPMEELRNYVSAVAGFAVVAMLLAAIGVYGVMAYSVAQRTREIGIRRALGATTRDVLTMLSRSALVPVAIGLLCGLAGSLALARLIASQLWGVTPTDPATFIVVSLLLAGVALVACLVPARRALRVDPTTALRTE